MKQTIFTILICSMIGLVSCRKDRNEQDIVQYDQSQIANYISANNITGMVADTSGIYYKIINKGTPDSLIHYTDNISFVFTIRSFDGIYTSTDTIANHYQGYAGHIITSSLPYGLELAIINDLKNKGGSMRVLIPSHLAYGVSGYGSGSISNASQHIAGNQCIDYYVHVISNQAAYDDQVIQNYIKNNSLTGYTKTATGLYYKVTVQGTGTDSINQNSIVTANLTGRLLNNIFFSTTSNIAADTITREVPDLVKGVQEGLSHVTTGASISMLIPSQLGYGQGSVPGDGAVGDVSVPVNSPLRFEFEVKRVSP